MSQTYYALLMKSNVPNREQLQGALDKLGFDLQLDPEFTPFEDEGGSPCVLGGEAGVGFEIEYMTVSELLEEDDDDDPELAQIIGDNDYAIAMSWGSSGQDLKAVLMVCIALAKEFGATISYEMEEADEIDNLYEGIEEADDL